MDFKLRGYIEFSEPVDKLRESLSKLLQEASSSVLRRGVPKEQVGTLVKGWEVDEGNRSRLLLELEGTTYLRPHDALLRLKNYLAREMGKRHKIGLRTVHINEYTIALKPENLSGRLPEGLLESLNSGKLTVRVPWVERVWTDGETLFLSLKNLNLRAIENRYVERIMKRLKEKIDRFLYGGKAEHWELIWRSEEREPVWRKDPTKEMEKLGWIKRFDVGVWWHGPVTTKILRTLQSIVQTEIIKPLGFQEVILPKTVPLDVWLKTGHVPGSSNSFYYVCRPLSWDPEFWEDFSDHVKVTGEIPYKMLKEKVSPPTSGICFAQCPPLYWFFHKKLLPDEDLPLKFYDNSGVSYRWEGGGLHGLERDSEFHRIEIVWIGTKEQNMEIQKQLLERYRYIFNEVLEIEWRMARVTPWYMQQADQFQGEETELAGTIDFEAWLPWRGGREESEWLEFQNLTIAGTKFSDAWKFRTRKGEKVWTGCSGIGLERWMVVLLSQKGIDPSKWPEKFRERFGEMPKPIRTI